MRNRKLVWRAVGIAYLHIILVTGVIQYILIQGFPGVPLSGFRNVLRYQVYDSQLRLLETGMQSIPQASGGGRLFTDQPLVSDYLFLSIKEEDLSRLSIRDKEPQRLMPGLSGGENVTAGVLHIKGETFRIVYAPRPGQQDYIIAGINEAHILQTFEPWIFVYIIINICFFTVMFFFSLVFVRWMLKPIRLTEMRLRENTDKLRTANDRLRREISRNKDEDRFQRHLAELHRLFAMGSATSYFNQFLTYMRELFKAEAVILTFLDGRYIQNIFFSADASLRITFPIGFDSRPMDEEKRELINAALKKRILYVPRPRMSLFGKCSFESSVIFAAGGEGDASAILQVGMRGREQGVLQKQHLERFFNSVEPALIAIAQEEHLKKLRHDAILDKRASEEQFRKIFDASQDMIIDVDKDGLIKGINQSGITLLGASSSEELLQRSFSDFFVQSEACDYLYNVLAVRTFIRDHEIILTNGSNSFICLLSATAEFDGRGSFAGFSGTVKDISERVKLDRELWAMNIELSEANTKIRDTQVQVIQNEKLASIGQLSAGIAHEINNPLGFIQSNFNTMGKYTQSFLGCIDELSNLNSRDKVEAILSSNNFDYIKNDVMSLLAETSEGIDRILSIVGNLKNFARVDAGAGHTDVLEIKEAVDNTLVIARNEYKYHAEAENRIKKSISVQCNSGEIKQVLLNLIVNSSQAIKEKMDEGGKIYINAWGKDEKVYITVEDNGPGIPLDKRLRIFDPFFTTKEVGKGTGLGLSISHDIVVNKHKGRIFIDDSDLGGARFTIVLPASHKEEDADAGELLDEFP